MCVCMYVCLYVCMYVGGAPSLTLWVGTKYGRVSVYIINCVENMRQAGQYKNEILPTGW